MRKKRNKEFLVLELTPLIDVVFILLIFFIVTSVFQKKESTLNLTLPKTSNAVQYKSKQKDLIIEISDKQIMANHKIMSFDNLTKYLENITDKKLDIILKIGDKTQYKKVIKVMDLLQKNELYKLKFISKDQNGN